MMVKMSTSAKEVNKVLSEDYHARTRTSLACVLVPYHLAPWEPPLSNLAQVLKAGSKMQQRFPEPCRQHCFNRLKS
ncbi:uncharacterized protein LOC142795790 isoform X2 [Rhipicephalus microplus]|uniref:uncharacterized protein LOC142795790 isoform X2 n=1 Tax=Rhipicephalus microplus TaxID=6941 RepID=UPI003F6BE9A5